MRRLGHDLTAALTAFIRDTAKPVTYEDHGVRFETPGGAKVFARLDGEVVLSGLWGNTLPLDWGQRRSVRRAVEWRHRYEQAALIRLGKEARRNGDGR